MADPVNTVIDRIPLPGGAAFFDYFNDTLYCTGSKLRRINLTTKQITEVGPPATASFAIVALDLHRPFPVTPDVIGAGEPDGRIHVVTISDDFDEGGFVHFDDFEAAELTPPLLDQFRQFKLSPQAASNYRPGVSAMVVTSDNRFLYYFDITTLLLGVVDLEAGPRMLGAYQLDAWSMNMVISPDNRFIYAAHPFANSISVVDTTADWHKAVHTVPVVNGPFGLDISADGKRLFVAQTGNSGVGDPSDLGSGTLTVLDTATMQGQQIFTGASSVDVAVNAAGTRAYVSNTAVSGTVSVVDVTSGLEVIDTITGFTDQSFLRLRPDGTRLYVMDWAGSPAIAVAAV